MPIYDILRSPILRFLAAASVLFWCAVLVGVPMRGLNILLDCWTISFGVALVLTCRREAGTALTAGHPSRTDLLIVSVAATYLVIALIRSFRLFYIVTENIGFAESEWFAFVTLLQLGFASLAIVAFSPNGIPIWLRGGRALRGPLAAGAVVAVAIIMGDLYSR